MASGMGVCAASGSEGQGMPTSPTAEKIGPTAQDQIPQKQEQLVLVAVKAATLPANMLSSAVLHREFQGDPLPGVACEGRCSYRASCPMEVCG